jgi:hypothetical protein
VGQTLISGHLAAKTRFFRFLAPFWILPPSWITALKYKTLKMFFGSILNILHKKIVRKFHDRWRSNRFFSKKCTFDAILIFGCHFDFFFAITDFLLKVLSFLNKKPFEV